MKYSLPVAGAFLMLIAVAASIMEMNKPQSSEKCIPAPLARTKSIRHDAPSHPSIGEEPDRSGETLPKEETISTNRKKSQSSSKTIPSTNQQDLAENSNDAVKRQSQGSFIRPAAMPLAYQANVEQLADCAPDVPPAALDSVMDQFEEEIGPQPADPADPEYAQNWQSAEFLANARLRARYGWSGYAGMQKAAVLGN